MLRSEHVIARLSRGRLVPHQLPRGDPRALEVVEELCEAYAGHVGGLRSRLEEELAVREEELGPRLDPRRGFRIVRGLSKLLEERAVWVSPTSADPYTIRTRIFELAAALPEPPAEEAGLLGAATRDDVLARVAAETGIEDPAALMYADRQGAQLLTGFEEPSPEELIAPYHPVEALGHHRVEGSGDDPRARLGDERPGEPLPRTQERTRGGPRARGVRPRLGARERHRRLGAGGGNRHPVLSGEEDRAGAGLH